MAEIFPFRVSILRTVCTARGMSPVSIDMRLTAHTHTRGPFAQFPDELIARIHLNIRRHTCPPGPLIGDVHQLVVGLLGRDVMRFTIAFSGRHHLTGPHCRIGRLGVFTALRHRGAVTALAGQLVQLLEAAGDTVVIPIERRLCLLLRLPRLLLETAARQ